MGAINDHELATYVGTGRVTGSIQRIHATAEITLTDWTMGRYVSNAVDINAVPNKATTTSTTDLTIGANATLEGPFIAVNISAGAGIIYHNGIVG